MWPIRSMLFVPGHKLDWIKKSPKYRSDAIMIDLEDAVPSSEKMTARATVRAGIAALAELGVPAFVRINAFDQGGRDDVTAIAIKGLAGVMLPKARVSDEIRALDGLLSFAEGKADLEFGSIAILALPETAEGIADARLLASASARVRGVVGVIGGPVSGDVARAVGFRPTMEGSEQLYVTSKVVLDSRAGGAPYPMAGIIGTRIDDLGAVRRLIVRAKALGYTGVHLIHPSHVAIANEVFTPTDEEVSYYAGLLSAFKEAERAGSAAVSYHGTMVDYAMLPFAEEILRDARRRGVLKE